MVEADSHLKMLPVSKFYITKCLSTLICCPLASGSSLTQLYPQYLAQISGFWFWVTWGGVKMMSLCHGWRLTTTSNCFLHPYWTHIKYLSTLICCPLALGSSLTQLYPPKLALSLGFWVTRWVKMMSLCHAGWNWQPSQTDSHIHKKIYKVLEHIDEPKGR